MIYGEGVPEGQSVSLVAFDGELETFADRTNDRSEVLEALEELGYVTARGPQQTITFTGELIETEVSGVRDQAFYERRQRHREFIADLEKKVLRVGDAISATMSRYATADGRRVLVVFTPGYPRIAWAPAYAAVDYVNVAVEYPVHDLWRNVALEASDLGFTLFAVDSSGVQASFGSDVDIGITDSLDTAFDRAAIVRPEDTEIIELQGGGESDFAFDAGGGTQDLGSWLQQTRKSMLVLAAEATGGEAIFAGADVGRSLAIINDTVSHHYSVAYAADHMGDGKAHAIEVEVKGHPEYRVVHRTGYIDQPVAVRSGRRMRSAMLFGNDANPLGIRVEIGEASSRFRIGAAGSKRVRIPIHVKIPFGRIEMIQRGDIHWAKLWITLFNEDSAGNQSALASYEQPVSIDSDRYPEAVARGYFSYHATVETEGGRQRVFVGIQEELNGRISIVPLEFQH
jgi:VWFA-related protein